MKKGNAFDALLAADPEQPSPSASPAKPGRANKAAGFRHGVVCGAWHSGQVLFLLHRHGDTKNWALALLTDKVVDEAQGRDQALALLASAVPSLPNVKLIDAPPMKESGTAIHFALAPSAALANQQLHFRTQPAAANLFASNAFQLAVLSEASARLQSLAPPSAPPPPSALPVVSFGAASAAASSAAEAPKAGRMLVLCGLPGSGKSTFSGMLLKALPGWTRVNQDELGTRQACEALAEEALGAGHHVLVDRCNFNAQQRKTWVALAQKWNCARIDAVYLHVSLKECLRRVQERPSHPTLHPGEESVAVITDFARNFVPPMPREGFTQVHMLSEGEDAQELIAMLGKM